MRAPPTTLLHLHLFHHRDRRKKYTKRTNSRAQQLPTTTQHAQMGTFPFDTNFIERQCIHAMPMPPKKKRKITKKNTLLVHIYHIHIERAGLWLSFHIWIGHFIFHPIPIHHPGIECPRTHTHTRRACMHRCRSQLDKRDSRSLSNVQLSKIVPSCLTSQTPLPPPPLPKSEKRSLLAAVILADS